MERKKANFTRKKERDSHTPKNTSKSKKEVRIAFTFAFAFAFCSTPFYLMVKGIKLKKKIKEKEKSGVRIRPSLAGYVLGSGHGSAFTDPVRVPA
jgi:hypothetical protein